MSQICSVLPASRSPGASESLVLAPANLTESVLLISVKLVDSIHTFSRSSGKTCHFLRARYVPSPGLDALHASFYLILTSALEGGAITNHTLQRENGGSQKLGNLTKFPDTE